NAQDRERYNKLSNQLTDLKESFSKTLNDYQDSLIISKDQLAGLSENYIDSLEKTADGNYTVTMAYSHYFPFMDNAKDASARKQLYLKFMKRGGQENVKRLE